MIQNNQPPDVLNLNSFSSYAKDGLLYSADEVLSAEDAGRLPRRRSPAAGSTRASSTAFPSSPARARSSTTRISSRRPASPGPPKTWDGLRPGGPEDPGARRGHHRVRPAARAGGGPGRVVDLDVERRRRLEDGRRVGDQQRGQRADAHLPRRPRQPRQGDPGQPGKTNRTDGAFQLFKDGKVGMVMGFSPLAAQLDRRGQGHLRGGRDADEHSASPPPWASRTTSWPSRRRTTARR